ncbi:MAG TPA: carbohydrate porin [Acetobacteraceae bacterium]|nr:carbohydrate porin [Acetobacteraceae bacterium]
MPRRHTTLPALGTAVLALWATAAAAQTDSAAASQTAPPAATGFWERSSLLGDPAGLRDALGKDGISFGLQETSEVFGNVSGGIHRGADYNGLTEMSLGIDTQKAFGWAGGTFNVSALQIHGRSLSADNLDTLQTASGIEAEPATRLWELWYQQAFLAGRVDVKLGQQSIDQEFMTSQGSALFINTVMGWPMIPSADLYAGGPAYPLSSLGVRLRARPTAALTVLAGVFDDNPPGGPFADDSQLRGAEAAGHAFNLNTGALWIAELQYAINQPASDGTPSGLAGTYKLGFWYDSGSFPDQRFDTLGRSLDDPQSSGVPRLDRGNASIYAVADQTVWVPDPRGPRALAVFARAMGAPPDRNLISFSVDAGLTLKAPFRGRDNDTAGIGFGLAKVSADAAAEERESGVPGPVRGTETFIELTYQLQLTPWWLLQPDFQYVFNPGGGVVDPQNPPQRVGNEAVFGLRTAITLW